MPGSSLVPERPCRPTARHRPYQHTHRGHCLVCAGPLLAALIGVSKEPVLRGPAPLIPVVAPRSSLLKRTGLWQKFRFLCCRAIGEVGAKNGRGTPGRRGRCTQTLGQTLGMCGPGRPERSPEGRAGSWQRLFVLRGRAVNPRGCIQKLHYQKGRDSGTFSFFAGPL